ncbi:NYN domain-containing protein [Phytohabitans rumicis]|uniref:NYN domain-containing protein n=1 Tax=Phytohabitans rumicis TaxID=1076125 RepID=A0A6V8KY69_9ACTN|nr:NYN domain-containing protein [Phytohabitans rumicis]GFJ90053.1 hypothetical protein Prum_036950 [Phytohabitans rumicis]
MRRVRVYVDGFNLYHGMKAQFGRAFHWLDLEALGRTLLRPGQRLDLVRYFTARVREHDAGRRRQVTYLEALHAFCALVETQEGRFQQKTCRCFACQATWTTYEEKETDVNLAVALVEDAALDRFDIALIVSADSDLCPAIRAVRRIRPGSKIIAIFPPKRHSDELKRTADAVYWLGRDKLRQSQLPPEVITPSGIKLTRPSYWG